MSEVHKLRAVRAIVRPDRREAYLEGWKVYAGAAREIGAEVRLFEDQLVPGRFLELTEHVARAGAEGALVRAAQQAELKRLCVRREGEDLLYREARFDTGEDG